MSTTLGATTLPDPVSCTMGAEETAVQRRMANGALRTTIVARDRRWQLSWAGLNTTDRGTLRTAYEIAGNQTFKPPDTATTYTVHVAAGSWQEDQRPMASGIRYWVSFALVEV